MKSTLRAAFLTIALFCLAGHAAAASLAPAARIVRAEAGVTVKYAGTGDFVSVWRHEKVGPGDIVSTGPDGLAELELPDGSLVALGNGATLALEAIEPARTTDERTGEKRVVITARLRLTTGRMRTAVAPGSLVFLSAGRAMVVSDPAAGADVTVAADFFENGYYLRVTRGCAFALLRDSRVLPVCGDSRVRVEMFADRLTPLLAADPYTDSITLPLTGEPPAISAREELPEDITLNGKRAHGPGGIFRVAPGRAGTEKTVTAEGAVPRGWAALLSMDDGAKWVTVAPAEDGRWRYRLDESAPVGPTLTVKSVYVGVTPPDVTALAGRTPAPPAEEAPVVEKKEVDPNDVASRFVQAFSGALSRGDTGALAGMVSADYNGAAGGTSRSALLRGVSEFFRAGGTLTVSAYAAGASLADDTVICTMSFSSRANTTGRSGNLKLWLTSDGRLTHSEGEWVF